MDIYTKKCKNEKIDYVDGYATHGWMEKFHYPDNKIGQGKVTIVKVTGDELLSRGYKLVRHTD
jgi:hypothetical protein